jgi:hypothetical protein
MRRLMQAASFALAAVLLSTVGTAVPASAAVTVVHSLSVRGSAYIVDDELWPAKDQTGTHALELKSLHLPTDDRLEWDPCEDTEVTALTRVKAYPYADRPGRIAVGVEVILYEGTSCNSHRAKDQEFLNFDMAPGETVEKQVHVKNQFAGDDEATVTLKLTNWYSVWPTIPVKPIFP